MNPTQPATRHEWLPYPDGMHPTKHTTISLRSVSDLLHCGHDMHGCCERHGCRKNWRLSLRKEIAALGADFPYSNMRYRLTCPVCGGGGWMHDVHELWRAGTEHAQPTNTERQ
jgi:hypothetical protein